MTLLSLRQLTTRWLLCSAILSTACTTQEAAITTGGSGPGGGSPVVDAGAADQSTSSAMGGLPCDVQSLLSTQCSQCHGSPPTGNAPNSLLSRDDLVAPSLSDPSKSTAEVAVERMKDTANPMPPTGLLAASDRAILANWVNAGMPVGSCQQSPPDMSGVYNTPTVCTSNAHWLLGDVGNSSMHPGRACIQCHTQHGEGPRYSIAGTVFPTAHEPDDCFGTKNVQVVITDATGKVLTLTPNLAGNFSTRTAITPPYTAKVVSGSSERAMGTPQTVGDCNTCHTESGTDGAPGRVMAP